MLHGFQQYIYKILLFNDLKAPLLEKWEHTIWSGVNEHNHFQYVSLFHVYFNSELLTLSKNNNNNFE